jgi:hypothetical protein
VTTTLRGSHNAMAHCTIAEVVMSTKNSCFVLVLLILVPVLALAQAEGDFRSHQTGDWNDVNSWERYDGTTWAAAPNSPTSVDGGISIQSGHTITVTVDETIDQFTVNTGGGVIINAGVRLTILDGTGTDIAVSSGAMTVNGILKNFGAFTTSGATISFASGSKYEHAANNNNLPKSAGGGAVTWDATSVVEVTGITTGSITSMFEANTTYGNIIWDCPGEPSSGNANLGGNLKNIAGYFRVVSAGSGTFVLRFFPSGQTNQTANIGGDFVIEGGSFQYCGGTSTGCALNIGGNYNQTGGTFASNVGSGNVLAVNYTGADKTFTQSGGTLTNTNMEWTVKSSASLTLNNNLTVGTGRAFTVENAALINCGTNVISGPTFTLSSGGSLGIGSADGITSSGATGNIQTATRNFDVGANYIYNGTAGSQVTGTGLPATVNNLTVSNSADVSLSGSVQVNGTLSLLGGDLSLNGNNVTLGPSGTLSETASNTIAGTSGLVTTTRTLTAPNSADDIAGLGVRIGSSADLGSTVITRGHTVQTSGGSASIKRYFDVTPSTNTGLNATLIFKYDESELNLIPEASLTLFRSEDNGVSWAPEGGTLDMTANTLTVTGLDALSRWTAGDVDAPLPIQLASFIAVALSNSRVKLDWTTLSEVNNYGFYIQKRRNNESDWSEIANSFVTGRGTTNEPQHYSFTDNNAARGAWQYRLKQVDLDGAVHFADPILVDLVTDVTEVAPMQFALLQNYPNPFNPSTEIKFSVESTKRATLEVYNIIGQKVATLFDEIAEAGQYYRVKFSAEYLASGVYFYRLQSGAKSDLKKFMLLR